MTERKQYLSKLIEEEKNLYARYEAKLRPKEFNTDFDQNKIQQNKKNFLKYLSKSKKSTKEMEALRQIKAEKAKKEPIKKNKRTAKGRYISQKAVIYEKT